MKTLLPMTDFVLETFKDLQRGGDYISVILNYANFLKQPLRLEMFVPCDEDGNVLKEPKEKVFSRENGAYEFDEYCKIYEKAKEKVLFEGFEVIKDTRTTITVFNSKTKQDIGFAKGVGSGETIESLILFTDFTGNLTPTSLKQIGI